ncbi:hypothetical protein [Flagellimonas sp.]|uniref:hypothetical protein n=1 Tax=Flagellimonas sp. TaxID=2058762 RepID=UPI003C7DF55D
MKNRKIIVFILSSMLIILMGFVYKSAHPTTKPIAQQDVDIKLAARQLVQELARSNTTHMYGDKVVQTYGSITNIQGNVLTLESCVVVTLMNKPKSLVDIGDRVTIKGRCIGYDDFLHEVKLDQASIIHKQ